MRYFTMTMTGLMCLGMTVLAFANPAMLPKHPGYPSSGEFANDTGQKNLTYSQSIEEAAKSGDITMAAIPTDAKNIEILKRQDIEPLRRGSEQPEN